MVVFAGIIKANFFEKGAAHKMRKLLAIFTAITITFMYFPVNFYAEKNEDCSSLSLIKPFDGEIPVFYDVDAPYAYIPPGSAFYKACRETEGPVVWLRLEEIDVLQGESMWIMTTYASDVTIKDGIGNDRLRPFGDDWILYTDGEYNVGRTITLIANSAAYPSGYITATVNVFPRINRIEMVRNSTLPPSYRPMGKFSAIIYDENGNLVTGDALNELEITIIDGKSGDSITGPYRWSEESVWFQISTDSDPAPRTFSVLANWHDIYAEMVVTINPRRISVYLGGQVGSVTEGAAGMVYFPFITTAVPDGRYYLEDIFKLSDDEIQGIAFPTYVDIRNNIGKIIVHIDETAPAGYWLYAMGITIVTEYSSIGASIGFFVVIDLPFSCTLD